MTVRVLPNGGRFGVIQGRLTPAPPGVLQRFPVDEWRDEFARAGALGMAYIELLLETEHTPGNPFWHDADCAAMQSLAAENGGMPYSVCVDYVMPQPLNGVPETVDYCIDVIRRAAALGAPVVVLPLLEGGELTMSNRHSFVGPLRTLGDVAEDVGATLALETILNGAELTQFLAEVDHPRVRVTFDTGNRAAFGHDIPGDIRALGALIHHVHIKDKNAANQNVRLGTGLVDFMAVAEALTDIGYAGNFTFETTRGTDALRTARHNVGLVTYFMEEAVAARA